MSGKRALVIGGSLGGMIAAHLLRQAGWDAVVLERNSTDLETRGAGLGTHPSLVEILSTIDPALGEAIGVEVRKVICLDAGGRLMLERPTARMMTAWGHLYTSLRRALPVDRYRLGRTLERVEQDDAGVTAILTDGTRERGDLLIGADGLRSTVREQLFPMQQPVYAGYIAWRVMLEESAFPRELHREVFETYCFCLPEGEQLLGYPVPGRNNETRAGHRAYNIVWYRPVEASRELPDMLTDESGRLHPWGIAPPLIRPEIVARAKADTRRLMAPQVAEIVERSRPFFQPIYDLDSARLVSGRVVLLGDAAFVARPHMGAGVTKAALDAAALADSLVRCGNDLAAALARYQRVQQPLGHGLVALARQEGAYLGARLKRPEERTPDEQERDFQSIIWSHENRRVSIQQLVSERAARLAG